MALLRKLFYRKPPDGLLEICERVYGMFFFLINGGFEIVDIFVVFLRSSWNKLRI